MKNVNKPIRIPQDLRDTVIALHIDPAEMVQRYIDGFRFYPYFSTRSEQEKLSVLSRIRHGMSEFQRSGRIYVDPILNEINQRYSKLLIMLSNEQQLSPKEHDKQSVVLIKKWEREVRPLINYPDVLTLEGSGAIRLSFDFMLTNIDFGHKISRYVQMYMKRISMAYLYAYAYPGNKYNNQVVMQFFEDLYTDKGDVFLPRSEEQIAVIEEFGNKFSDLFNELAWVKNYKKRLEKFRPIIKEWASKMAEIT